MIKFNTPFFPLLIKSIIIAIVLAAIGYFTYPQLGLEHLSAARLFSCAILIGAILATILINVKVKVSLPGKRLESIFVGNLAFKASAGALRELFEEYGEVHAVRLMTDRVTRRPRGYAFVEMDATNARQAINALNGTEFYGRELKVSVANDRKS